MLPLYMSVSLFFAVYIPVIIQDQMLFKQFTMLKAFLSAVIAGIKYIHSSMHNRSRLHAQPDSDQFATTYIATLSMQVWLF